MYQPRHDEDYLPIKDESDSTSNSDTNSLFDSNNNEADSASDTDLDSLLEEVNSNTDDDDDLFDNEVRHPPEYYLAARLATVRSGPRPESFLETVKKTGPYGLVNWDRSPDRKIRSGLGKNGPVLSLKRRPIKRPDRMVRYSGTAVQSSLRPNRLVGFIFLGDLEHVSVTPKRYS